MTSKHSVQQRRRLMVCRLAACSQTIYTFIQSLTRHFCVKVRIKKVGSRFFFLRTRHFVLVKTSHSGWRINSIRQKQVKVWSYNRPGTPKGKSKEIHGLLRPYIFIVKIFETAKAWRQFRLSVYHYIHTRWKSSSLFLQKFYQQLSVTKQKPDLTSLIYDNAECKLSAYEQQTILSASHLL